jgi:hypothetical protein
MPTGPSSNQYIIPDILLSDTFNEWLTVTNTDIIEKLNFLKVYTATGTGGITVDTLTNGEAMISIAEIIPGPHTFTGNITFNGTVTTVNSTEMTVDDYNLVLGHTAGGSGGSDAEINAAGGGGIILKGLTTDKEFLWKTGPDAWYSSESLRLAAGKRFLSGDDTFRLHTTTGGLHVKVTGAGTTYDTLFYIGTSAGATAEVARIRQDTTVEIYNGVNRKRFHQAGAGYTFGHVIRPMAGGFTLAKADSAENAEAIGIICGVNGNTYDVMFQGEISGDFTTVLGSTLTAGNVYFLSATTAGFLSASYPAATPNNITKAMLLGFGPTQGYVLHYVGVAATGGIDVDLGASSSEGVETIIQGSGFVIGDVVRVSDDGAGYDKAAANSAENAEAIGVITGVINATTFRLKTFGINLFNTGITLDEGYQSGISSGQVYFLSTSPGKMTLNQPTSASSLIKPMMVGLPSNKALVLNRNAMIPADSGGGGGPTEPASPATEGLVGKTFLPVFDGSTADNLFYAGGNPLNPDQNAIFRSANDTETTDAGQNQRGYYVYHLRLNDIVDTIPANATHVVLQGVGQANYSATTSYSRVIVGPYSGDVGLTNSYDPANLNPIPLKYTDMEKYSRFLSEKYNGDFIHNQFPTSGKSTFSEHVVCRIGKQTVGSETFNAVTMLMRTKGVDFINHSIRVVGFYCEANLSGDIPSTPKNKVSNPFFEKREHDAFQKLGNPSYTNVVGGTGVKNSVAADGWTVCAVGGVTSNTLTTTFRGRISSDTENGLDSSCSAITQIQFTGNPSSPIDAVALLSNSNVRVRSVPNGKATLSFIARVSTGTQRIQAGFSRNYYNNTISNETGIPDSSYAHIGTATLTTEWKRYFFTFDLPDLADGGQFSTSNLHFILGHKNYTPLANPWLENFNSMVNSALANYWVASGTQIEFAHVQLEMGAIGTPIEVLSDAISNLETDAIVALGEGEHTVVTDSTTGLGYTALRTRMQSCITNGVAGVQRRLSFKSKRGNTPTDPPVSGRANLVEGNATPVFIKERTSNAGAITGYGFYTILGSDSQFSSGVPKGGYSFYYLVDATVYPFPTDSNGNLIF